MAVGDPAGLSACASAARLMLARSSRVLCRVPLYGVMRLLFLAWMVHPATKVGPCSSRPSHAAQRAVPSSAAVALRAATTGAAACPRGCCWESPGAPFALMSRSAPAALPPGCHVFVRGVYPPAAHGGRTDIEGHPSPGAAGVRLHTRCRPCACQGCTAQLRGGVCLAGGSGQRLGWAGCGSASARWLAAGLWTACAIAAAAWQSVVLSPTGYIFCTPLHPSHPHHPHIAPHPCTHPARPPQNLDAIKAEAMQRGHETFERAKQSAASEEEGPLERALKSHAT